VRQAAIVSTARTPIGKAYRGAFNDTHAVTMGGHALAQAISRAGLEPGDVGDVVFGSALTAGVTGGDVARQISVRAGVPVSTPAATVAKWSRP
jgi:acetyl-CoA C-acetyltransferase